MITEDILLWDQYYPIVSNFMGSVNQSKHMWSLRWPLFCIVIIALY